MEVFCTRESEDNPSRHMEPLYAQRRLTDGLTDILTLAPLLTSCVTGHRRFDDCIDDHGSRRCARENVRAVQHGEQRRTRHGAGWVFDHLCMVDFSVRIRLGGSPVSVFHGGHCDDVRYDDGVEVDHEGKDIAAEIANELGLLNCCWGVLHH